MSCLTALHALHDAVLGLNAACVASMSALLGCLGDGKRQGGGHNARGYAVGVQSAAAQTSDREREEDKAEASLRILNSALNHSKLERVLGAKINE